MSELLDDVVFSAELMEVLKILDEEASKPKLHHSVHSSLSGATSFPPFQPVIVSEDVTSSNSSSTADSKQKSTHVEKVASPSPASSKKASSEAQVASTTYVKTPDTATKATRTPKKSKPEVVAEDSDDDDDYDTNWRSVRTQQKNQGTVFSQQNVVVPPRTDVWTGASSSIGKSPCIHLNHTIDNDLR